MNFRKILSYPISAIFYLFFFLTLLFFHIVQMLALKFGGYKAHKTSVDWFNFFLLRCLNILGTSVQIDNPYELPTDRPCIFVANHQGMFDIHPISWHFRKHHPKFISKKELGKGIPGISYNLNHGGNLLIDRKNPRESLTKMSQFADYLNQHNRSAVIFPEGTRSRTGQPKKFAIQGLQMLFKKMPDALVVPITINNSWKLFRYGSFPLGIGVSLHLKVHRPLPVASGDPKERIAEIEQTIINDVR